MSLNYSNTNPKRLHSPLLEGKFNQKKQNENKGKRTYYSPSNEESIDHTLDSTLFPLKEKFNLSTEKNFINHEAINSLETLFKIASVLILATGLILSILELINIIRSVSAGNFNCTNSILVFFVVFIGTLLANIMCLGFIHLIKTTKYIYLFISKFAFSNNILAG
ncbi:MAG: hypothetical protein HYY52_07675 [Candidatus Melainabacteria bacterium]|nr:hypothetical protein [Candidatus Melainabacteria bacterium]